MATTPFREDADFVTVTTAGTSVTLNELAAIVTAVSVLTGGATSIAPTNYSLAGGTIVTGAPTATEVQFTGTPAAPNDTLTFNASQPVGTVVLYRYVKDGDAGQ